MKKRITERDIFTEKVRNFLLDKSVIKEAKKKKIKTQKEFSEFLGYSYNQGRNYFDKMKNKDKINLWPKVSRALAKKKRNKYDKKKHSQNPEKIKQLERLYFFIEQSKAKSGKILSLCASEPDFEESLLKISSNFTFSLYEYSKKVFLQLAQSITKINESERWRFSIFNSDIRFGVREAIKSTDLYAHAILDFCGKWTTYKDIIRDSILFNLVDEDGIIFFTFVDRDWGNTERSSLYNEGVKYVNECLQEDRLLNKTTTYDIVYKGQYNNGGARMFTIILKRVIKF